MTSGGKESMRPLWPNDNPDGSSDLFARFRSLVDQTLDRKNVVEAAEILKNLPLYDGDAVSNACLDDVARRKLRAEWTWILRDGPGILVIRSGTGQDEIIDQATALFERLIDEEKRDHAGSGDHFAKAGSNDRVWNALQKHCLQAPENFARYYASNAIALAADAWLGPGYQVTAQVNRVNPKGAAQSPHRDYHLGFMSGEQTCRYPMHVHTLSAALTLQGAIAHCDMPLETGPTQYLPYSHLFEDGYRLYGEAQYQSYFADNYVQLALKKGDMVFFNPAVMHAAGENQTDNVFRLANLLQISSAFGRSIETVDRFAMAKSLYPVLLALKQKAELSDTALKNIIAASAEGYSFPTNLDRDPPVHSMAPKTQAQLMSEALDRGDTPAEFREALDALAHRQSA